MTDDTKNYTEVTTVSCGRHSELDVESDCLNVTKKVLQIDRDTTDLDLYHQIECDECGVIEEKRITGEDLTDDACEFDPTEGMSGE